jgi:hypothetical protein
MPTVRTNIRAGVKTVLQRVIAGQSNGYGHTYVNTITAAQCGDRPQSVENMPVFPFVNIDIGTEQCANANSASALQTGGNRQLWHLSFDLLLDCFMKAEDISAAQDSILADVQAAFGADYTINNTVFSCAYNNSIPFGMESDMPNCGITIMFTVWYRIYQTNPNVSG